MKVVEGLGVVRNGTTVTCKTYVTNLMTRPKIRLISLNSLSCPINQKHFT